MATRILCTPRTLTPGQRATATSIAGSMGLPPADDTGSLARRLIDARRAGGDGRAAVIAVVKSSSWGPRGARLTTAFMDNPSKELRREILRHLNMWSARANVQFVESTTDPVVRIDRRTGRVWGGYWSYIGRDILGIPANEPTMNFEGFTMRQPPSEFRRVVCHEAGHTLGFPHEHMRRALVQRIDPAKAYAYFQRTEGWSRQDVDDQVLTALDGRTIMGTPPDQTSIMCYQLPGEITRDGRDIVGGTRINETDYAFAARLYPRPQRTTKKAATRKAGAKTGAKKTGAKRTTAKKAGTKTAAAKKRAAATGRG